MKCSGAAFYSFNTATDELIIIMHYFYLKQKLISPFAIKDMISNFIDDMLLQKKQNIFTTKNTANTIVLYYILLANGYIYK